MIIERASFGTDPEKITLHPSDCIWLHLKDREMPRPFESPAIQWLDWKLHGQISRFLTEGRLESGKTTFLPTMHRIPIPYVAVESSRQVDWTVFLRNCQGLQLKRVLYFCEESARIGELEREMRGHASGNFPETLVFGADGLSGDR